MSKNHIEKLKHELERSKWIVVSEYDPDKATDSWVISRPNGDSLLKLNFTIFGNAKYGALQGNETMDNVIGCSVENYPEIDIYFRKYSKSFNEDLIQFIQGINTIK